MKSIKNEIGIIQVSRIIALTSTLIGISILLLFYLTENSFLPLVGLYFIPIAIIINSIFLVGLGIKIFSHKENKQQILISILFILLNIPVAYICYKIGIDLLSKTMMLD